MKKGLTFYVNNEKTLPFQEQIFAWFEKQYKEEKLAKPSFSTKFWKQLPLYPFPGNGEFICKTPGKIILWTLPIITFILGCYFISILPPPVREGQTIIGAYIAAILLIAIVSVSSTIPGLFLAIPVRFISLLAYFLFLEPVNSNAEKALDQKKQRFLTSQVNRYQYIIDYFDEVLIPNSTEELNNQKSLLNTNYINKRNELQTDLLGLINQRNAAEKLEKHDLVLQLNEAIPSVERQMQISEMEKEVKEKIQRLEKQVAYFIDSKTMLMEEKAKISEFGLDLEKVQALLEKHGHTDSGYQFNNSLVKHDPFLTKILDKLQTLEEDLGKNAKELQNTLPHRKELQGNTSNLLIES